MWTMKQRGIVVDHHGHSGAERTSLLEFIFYEKVYREQRRLESL